MNSMFSGMAGPPGDMSQGGPGEAQAMAFFEKVVTAYSAVHGPIDPASPPDIEMLLQWAENNPEAVWGAPAGGPDDSGMSAKEKALAAIGGVGVGAGKGRQSGMGAGAAAASAGQVEIVPEPGFVVKSKDERERKVFLNICGSPMVPAPGDWKSGQIPQAVEEALDKASEGDEAAAQSLRFPLSCGEPRSELDKEGEPCTVLDVVFNSDITKQAIAYKRLKVFVIELALSWVAQKHKLLLDPKYKLPRRDYFGAGAPPKQYIRAEPGKALITEVGDVEEEPSFPLRPQPQRRPTAAAAPPRPASASAAAAPGAVPTSVPAGVPTAPAELPPAPFTLAFEGKPAAAVLLRASLPAAAAAAAGLSARVAGEAVLIEGVPGHAPTRVPLPFAVDGAAAEAWLEPETPESASSNTGKRSFAFPSGVAAARVALCCRLPFRAYAEVAAEAARAAPHAAGALDLRDASYLELLE